MLIEIKEEVKQISNTEDAAEIFRSILSTESEADKDKEHFWVIGLNSKDVVLYVELVALGTLNNNLVHPRETYRTAIMKSAYRIIVGHNHPSGSLEISSEDKIITDRLRQAGKAVGIKLLDHVVIGNNKPECFSFQGSGLLEEDSKKIVGSNQNAKKEDVLDQIEEEQSEAISNVYDLKALAALSMNTAIYPDESKKIDWCSVINLFSHSLDAIEERLNEMDGLITDYRHKHKENEKPEKQLSLEGKIQSGIKDMKEALNELLTF